MCNLSLFKWWRHLHYWRNNSQRKIYTRLRTYTNILNNCKNKQNPTVEKNFVTLTFKITCEAVLDSNQVSTGLLVQ